MPGITVNGTHRPLGATPVHQSALDFLRGLGLTGAKEGCAEGECGACSVLVVRPDGDGARWTAVNACLVPAAALDGQEVLTAEGLGRPDALHPVQREMAVRGGSQCGYCTPGFVCSMAAEYYRPGRADPEPGSDGAPGTDGSDGSDGAVPTAPVSAWTQALGGNLCRCTGYRPILEAAHALGVPTSDDPLAARCALVAPEPAVTLLRDADGTFERPADLASALRVLSEDPEAVVVAGSTDVGVEVNIRGARPAHVVAVDRLPELRELTVGPDVITIGAALTLSEVEHALAGRVPLLDALWPQFGSRLIRNSATVGGNLGTASPVGDLSPALLALDADVVLTSAAGERTVPLAQYFTGYRRTVRRPGELIRAILVPARAPSISAFHKITKRRYDDISSVAVALALDVEDGTVRTARIGLGGVAATPIRATATEAALTGRPWTAETVEDAARVLSGEGTPIDDQRASAAYRSAMLGNALRTTWAQP